MAIIGNIPYFQTNPCVDKEAKQKQCPSFHQFPPLWLSFTYDGVRATLINAGNPRINLPHLGMGLNPTTQK
jgi:hypothetical protein